MAEFFKFFGICICVALADVVVWVVLAKIGVWDIDDDDIWLLPAILNGLAFSICAALLISQRI